MICNNVQSVVLNCKTGGLCKMIKSNEREKRDTKVIVADEPHIIEYWVREHEWGGLELADDSELRIVSTQRNLVSN